MHAHSLQKFPSESYTGFHAGRIELFEEQEEDLQLLDIEEDQVELESDTSF